MSSKEDKVSADFGTSLAKAALDDIPSVRQDAKEIIGLVKERGNQRRRHCPPQGHGIS